MRQFYSKIMFLVVAFLFISAPAFGGGGLQFFSTASPVKAGEAQSWMNRFSDCLTQPCQAQSGVPIPTQTVQFLSVTTQLDGTNLILKFKIPDRTHTKKIAGPPSSDAPLVVGDKVIVQIDPNGNRSMVLDTGTGKGRDYRYEITIKNNLIDRAVRREPNSLGMNWVPASGTQKWCDAVDNIGVGFLNCISANGESTTLLSPAPDYDLELKIPLSSVGLTSQLSNDIGLAILVVNDLGYDDPKNYITAVSFPFGNMPANTAPFTDPGVLETVSSSGPWINPSQWGTGYFVSPPGGPTQLVLSQSPHPWLSESIKLSFCDTGRWQDIDPADAKPSQDQLSNWYKYERDDPCKMGVWVKATNTGSTSATARLLTMWADAGLSTNTWRVVELTDPISFGPGNSAYRVIWDKVPFMGSVPGGTTHPCLRVYLLPSTLNRTDPNTGIVYDANKIKSVSNATQLAEFERAYTIAVSSWGQQAAQMNFTNLATGPCSRNSCKQPAIISNLDWFLATSAGMFDPRATYAQNRGEGRMLKATPVLKDDDRERPRVKGPWAHIEVQGFAVPESPAPVPYIFIDAIGGVAWAIPLDLLTKEELKLGFTVTNPALLYRDFSTVPVKEIKSPRRRIMLTSSTEAPPGIDIPKIELRPLPKEAFDPGETVDAQLLIKSGTSVGGPCAKLTRFAGLTLAAGIIVIGIGSAGLRARRNRCQEKT